MRLNLILFLLLITIDEHPLLIQFTYFSNDSEKYLRIPQCMSIKRRNKTLTAHTCHAQETNILELGVGEIRDTITISNAEVWIKQANKRTHVYAHAPTNLYMWIREVETVIHLSHEFRKSIPKSVSMETTHGYKRQLCIYVSIYSFIM